MKPILFHPSREALQAWLRDDTDDAELDDHISVCRRCANRLEKLDTDDGIDAADDLAGALALALAPPADLSTRLEHKVTRRLDSRVMMGVLSDLFAAGIETTRLLILDEPDGSD